MNKLALYLITLLGLCLTQPMAHAMSVQWTDYGYDNNGNVTELYDGDSGEIVGQYEYDPYGNTIKAEGQAAQENKIRFSTKEYDSSTGLYYYGYRHYDPKTGRWPSRDPIAERGGINLYNFVGNDGINDVDVLGENGLAAFVATLIAIAADVGLDSCGDAPNQRDCVRCVNFAATAGYIAINGGLALGTAACVGFSGPLGAIFCVGMAPSAFAIANHQWAQNVKEAREECGDCPPLLG